MSDLSYFQRFRQQCSKTANIAVLAKTFFAKNFQTKNDSGIIRASSCSSRQVASKYIHGDLARSGSIFDLRSHVDPSRSCWYISRYVLTSKHNGTTSMSVALFNRELLAKTCWWPQLTTRDLYEVQRQKFAPGSSPKSNITQLIIKWPDLMRIGGI